MTMLQYNRKSQGAILLMVLLIWQCIMLLIFYQYENIISRFMTTHQRYLSAKIKNDGVIFLKQIMQQEHDCQIPPTSISDLLQIPLAKWSDFACTGIKQGYRYYYYYEALGLDPCASIQSDSVASYFRYTLILQTPAKNLQQIRLQSTLARASPITLPCTQSPHFVKVGQQMIREI